MPYSSFILKNLMHPNGHKTKYYAHHFYFTIDLPPSPFHGVSMYLEEKVNVVIFVSAGGGEVQGKCCGTNYDSCRKVYLYFFILLKTSVIGPCILPFCYFTAKFNNYWKVLHGPTNPKH